MPARFFSLVLVLWATSVIGVAVARAAPAAGAAPAGARDAPTIAATEDDASPEGLLPAIVNGITVRNRVGAVVTQLAPGDTFYVDVSISDPDGFQDVIGVQLDLAFGAFGEPPLSPAFGGRFTWTRGGRPGWVREEPAGSTWEILPSKCLVDSVTNSIGPEIVRFAILPGIIARASSTGDWSIRAQVSERGALLVSLGGIATGFGMAERLEFVQVSPSAAFAPGLAGHMDVPLNTPASGALSLFIRANAQHDIRAQSTPLVGDSVGTSIAPGNIAWAMGDEKGVLTSNYTDLAEGQPAAELEEVDKHALTLTIDYPAGAPPQRYNGTLGLRLRSPSVGQNINLTRPLQGTVVAGGLAADSGIAEVGPTHVTAGMPAAAFTAALELYDTGFGTGVRDVSVGLPEGFGPPRVTLVTVNAASLPFTDRSALGVAAVSLPGAVPVGALLRLHFEADVTTRADTAGSPFLVRFDDPGTTLPPQLAHAGDPDTVGPESGWTVHVDPGPIAQVTVSPDNAELNPGGNVSFAAARTDAYGNPVTDPVTWRLVGSIGTLTSDGVFTATAHGNGFVIAEGGGFADTSQVVVVPILNEVRASVDPQVSRSMNPGAIRGEVFRLRLFNASLLQQALQSITFENRTTGPGTSAQLDGDWSTLQLWSEKFIINELPTGTEAAGPGPSVAAMLGTATMSGGTARFTGLNLRIAPGDSVMLLVRGAPSLVARDPDVLDLRVASASAITFSTAVSVAGTFPLDPAGGVTVDGMSAAQIGLTPIAAGAVGVNTVRALALDVRIPANGYAADQLRRLDVRNRGTAEAGADLTRIEAWVDDGNGSFEPSMDSRLGALLFTGERWQLTGLTRAVPVAGLRVFFSVDVSEAATAGRTIRLEIPSLPDVGIGMTSSNSGPVDDEIENPFELAITTANRITLSAAAIPADSVWPGTSDVPLLGLVANNSYADDRRVSAITVANATTGSGTMPQRDGELQSLTLRLDGNDNGELDDTVTDPPLATSVFMNGRATFSGFDWDLPAGKTRLVFVTGDVSWTGAADGDALSARLDGAADLTFDQTTVVAASWPVTSGAAWTVNGMLAAQIANLGGPAATLGPSDGPVEAMDIVVPRNGYADDVLLGLQLVNAGTAGAGEISELRLWSDGGDGTFGAGAGDDIDLGPLTLFNGAWQSTLLSVALGASGKRLFVSVRVSSAPADSTTIQLQIPVMGISTASGNSGPLDEPVTNAETQLLTTSPLVATVTIDPAASTLGQPLTVRMRVRNVGDETVLGVAPSALTPSGTGTVSFVSGPVPASAAILPSQEQTFTWTYSAAASGEARLAGSAMGTGETSGLERRSLNAASGIHRIFTQADSLSLFASASLPTTVSRGQTGVIPFTLTFTHSGAAGTSDVRVLGLRLRLEAEDGSGVVPADLLSRVEVFEGATVYLSRTSLETSGSDVDLSLATPLVVTRDEPVSAGIRFDVAPATTVPAFRVAMLAASSFTAEDATSGAPVMVRASSQGYPLRTGLGRIVAAATELRVVAVPQGEQRAGAGQLGVSLARWSVENVGTTGVTSDVRVVALTVALEDSAGADADPRDVLARVRVTGPLGTLVDRAVNSGDSSAVALAFAPALTVPVNTPLELRVIGDLAAAAPAGRWRLRVRDTLDVDARDPSSGARVAVTAASLPIPGDSLRIERAADTLVARGIASLPPTVPSGRPGVRALTARLRHSGDPLTARVRLDRLTVHVLDGARQPIAPASVLERVRAVWRGATVATVFDPPSTAVPAVLDLPNLTLEPGTVESLHVEVDIAAAALPGTMELTVEASGLDARDANLGTAVAVVADTAAVMPMSSGLTRIESAATTLEVGIVSLMPASVVGDGNPVPAGRLTLRNTAPAGSSTIGVDHLDLIASHGAATVAIGTVCERVEALWNGTPWASSGTLDPTDAAARLTASAALEIAIDSPETIELRIVPRAGASQAFRVGVDQAGVGVVQPTSGPGVSVFPATGQQFPLWTEETGFSERSLAGSYSNFPNPFAAGREPTRFVYYVEQPGRVTLRIFTARGEPVATVLNATGVSAGLRQGDAWDGRNGRGSVVANGVYLAELILQRDDGTTERALRKVAVVR